MRRDYTTTLQSESHIAQQIAAPQAAAAPEVATAKRQQKTGTTFTTEKKKHNARHSDVHAGHCFLDFNLVNKYIRTCSVPLWFKG